MTWIKKKDTQEAREFWSHVETVAHKVRGSQIYENYRIASPPQRHCLEPSEKCLEKSSEARTEDRHLKSA